MTHVTKDVQSVVKLVEACHSRIISLQGSNLTSIQYEQFRTRLHQSLSDEGITYNLPHYDSGGRWTFSFRFLHVQDSGVITDVSPAGPYPIQLSVGENVSVAFEPRDISKIDNWQSLQLDNTRFASLNKGSSFDFKGRLVFCDYYPNRPGGSFYLKVDSEFRVSMSTSVADWLRKQLWGGLPSGLDFTKKR